MKKTLLTLLMITSLGIYTTHAQITIYDTDVVGAGDVVEQAHDTLPGGLTIGPGGASQTWNFSSLSEDGLDTTFFQNPAGMPGSSNYPLANIGMTDTKEDSSWMYLTKNTLGLFVVGMSQYQNGQLINIPLTTTIITFPSTMGTNYSGNWNGILFTFPLGIDPDGPGPLPTIDSLRISRDATLNSNIDGWGNVTTPFGTFPSLRQIVTEENVDTTWTLAGGNWTVIDPFVAGIFGIDAVTYDTTRTARWWTDDPTSRFPIVEMSYEADGTVNNIDWQKSAPTVSVSEVKLTNDVAVYPNPAINEITIETSLTQNNSIEIIDVSGKLVSTFSFKNRKLTLAVADFDDGIYFYKIYDVNKKVLHTSKFVVAK
jgi:hypothetical protein